MTILILLALVDRYCDLSNPEENDKDIYATPDVIVHSRISINEDILDGECYASAYETGGRIHLYQELSEANPRSTSKSIAMSHDFISPRPHPPFRMSMSSASVSRCLHTMPNTQTAPYPEVVKKPRMTETPYLISQPSLSSFGSKIKMPGQPYPDPSHSVISFLQMQDITPVSFSLALLPSL